MKKVLARIKGGFSQSQKRDVAPSSPQPDKSFVAIGDVHGRADLLMELDRKIESDFRGWPIVFLGDYIDRGEESREVLELLISVSPEGSPPVICLMGNHERMLLDFLDNPSERGRRWIQNGGLQTLASFGVALTLDKINDPLAMKALRDRLIDAMGEDMVEWLRARPLSWRSGNVWAVHAGADPTEPMEKQKSRDLLWGHPQFAHQQRQDGQWIVHGHTVIDTPQTHKGRVAIDTGAYATGRLTAAAITEGNVRFLQTGSS